MRGIGMTLGWTVALAVLWTTPAAAAIVTVEDQGTTVVMSTTALEVRVRKDPWKLAVHDSGGELLLSQTPGLALQYGSYRVDAATSWTDLGATTLTKRTPALYEAEDEAVIVGETIQFTCSTTEVGRTMEVYVTFRNPYVFSVWATVASNVQDTVEVFDSASGEHFFGLGECWDAQSLDLKGLSVTMNNRTGTPDQGGYVPFYLSTRGYGLLIDNYLTVNFNFTQPARTTISAPAIAGSVDGDGYFDGSSMLWYFYYGPDPLDVIDRFTEHVSRPALPPPWAVFTTWQWRDSNTEAGVYADAAGMRAQNIPCGLIWIDRPWATGDQNMPPPFEWTTDLYPNGQQMAADLQTAGYKIGVWVAKNLYGDFDSPTLSAQLKTDAQPWITRDNPQMYKIDRGNEQRMDPYFTCQAYWDAWHEIVGDDFVTLPRTIAFRAQKYVSGKWPGDNDNEYDYPSGLRANPAVMLNLAICGFPFWGSDTGGFPDPPGNEVTIRWAQFSALCPIFETAGRPYNYSTTYRDIYRQYADLYTRLFPYRWSYAREAHETGHPICRALALEYPDDANGWNEKFEYLFGEWLLVAPMVEGGTQRDVYLPTGTWIDWWNGTHYTGGQTLEDYDAPLDTLPLFVKSGAIIPLIDVQQTWMGATVDPITLRIYPDGSTSFTIRADDGIYPGRTEPYTDLTETTVTCLNTPAAGPDESNVVAVTIGTSDIGYELDVQTGFPPTLVKDNDRLLQQLPGATEFDAAAEGWYYDPTPGGVTWIKLPAADDTSHAVSIEQIPNRVRFWEYD
ncbi:hypothetical protein JW916_05165 [Candidatus Sumerlaeota bacterium]|nr:hypothetical protein [Candidatus Sumerlaeota bacterium]